MAEVVEAWPQAVGAEIARAAWPARFQRDGTLVVHARDAVWAFELTQRADEIRRRLDLERVKFVPGPLPEARSDSAGKAPEELLPPSPEQVEEAARIAGRIGDENLRKLVQKAVETALVRASDDRSF
jgi:Dna[CI] antecedent, DciA